MADKRIVDLPEASTIQTSDLFVLQQSNQAKKVTGQTLVTELAGRLDGHGGISSIALTGTDGTAKTYTITYTDGSTFSFVVHDGEQGASGDGAYLYIRYASSANPSSVSTTPDAYIGICTTNSTTAPTDPTAYTWYMWKGNPGEPGEPGAGIMSISKTSTSGNTDTYEITYTDGRTPTTFTVKNGASIQSITKISTVGQVDTYAITMTDGTSGGTFTVTNGKSIVSITLTNGNHAPGTTDTYTILYNDGDTMTFTVYNGANGDGAVSSVAGIPVVGDAGNVPLIKSGSGAPTSATPGYANQLYFDTANNVMYYCASTAGGTYDWRYTAVTVDQALSSSSTNPVQNKVVKAALDTKAPVGLGITGASVGQYTKIKTVDANGVPTAYEAGTPSGGGGSAVGSFYASSSEAASTETLALTVADFALAKGVIIAITFTNGSTAAGLQLNISSTGAKSVLYNQAQLTGSEILANDTVTFMYDGFYYEILTIDRGSSSGTPTTLDGLTNVDIDTPTNGQALVYDSSNSKWVNGDVSGGSGSTDTFVGTTTTAASESVKEVVISGFSKREGAIISINFTNGNTSSYIYLKINNASTNDQVIYNTNQLPGNYVTIDPYDQVTMVYIGSNLWRILSVSSGAVGGGGGSSGAKETYYTSCTTAAATATKSLAVSNYSPDIGTILVVNFTNGSTSSTMYLSVNSGTAEPVVFRNSSSSINSYVTINANDKVTFVRNTSSSWAIIASNSQTSGGSGGATELNDLTDVSSTSPSNGQVLTYNSSTSLWTPQTPSSGGSARTYTKPWYVDTSGNVVEANTIQAAIDGCPLHGTVHIPWTGTAYSVGSSPIHITKPITLEGEYTGYYPRENIAYNASYAAASSYSSATYKIPYGTYNSATIGSNKPLIYSTSTTYGIYIHCYGVTLRNISIYCSSQRSDSSACLYMKNDYGYDTSQAKQPFNHNTIIENCAFQGTEGYGRGVWGEGFGVATITNTFVYYVKDGFYFNKYSTAQNTSITMTGCWAWNFSEIGYTFNECDYCTLISCACDSYNSSVPYGYYFINCRGCSAIACGCEQIATAVVFDGCNNCSFGGVIYLNDANAFGVRSFIASKIHLNDLYILTAASNPTLVSVPSGSKVLLTNTNITSVSGQTASNGGMHDFIAV